MRYNQMINQTTLDLDAKLEPGDAIDLTGYLIGEEPRLVQLTLIKRARDSITETVRPGTWPQWLPSYISPSILLSGESLTRHYFRQTGPQATYHADVRVQQTVTEGEPFFAGSFWMDVTKIIYIR